MAQDYASKGVQFYYVYKSLAHPGWNNYTAPFSMDERLLHLAEAERKLQTKIPWLCDGMDNGFAEAMGSAPNSEFIIDAGGKIIARHGWNKPHRLRAELDALVGPVDNPIDPASLRLPDPLPTAAAATGLVAGIDKPPFMRPILLKPVQTGDQPFYAKLRAEADAGLLSSGRGELYLGFSLDPLYDVHWNNLVTPIHVDLEGPESITFEPPTFDGPKVQEAADADPREFLSKVKYWDTDDVVVVKVTYYACNDRAGWCKRVEQAYELQLHPSRESGHAFRPEQVERIRVALDRLETGPPQPRITSSPAQLAAVGRSWNMKTFAPGNPKEWELHLAIEDGQLSGWSTYDRAHPDIDIMSFDGQVLRFLQFDAGLAPDEIVLELKHDSLTGTHLSAFGDFEVKGKAAEQREE